MVEGDLPAGSVTDDTQMTLFTAEGLLRAAVRARLKGICHPPSVVDHAYARWLWTQGEPSLRWGGKRFDGWRSAPPRSGRAVRRGTRACRLWVLSGGDDRGAAE